VKKGGIDEGAYEWVDVREWVEGKGFTDTEGDYDRLPARAKGVVRPPVWYLSKDSAGMSVGFEAETPAVAVRYTLLKDSLAMSHMPATGVSGMDLYGRDGKGRLRWVGDARPGAQRVVAELAKGMDVVRRDYRMYLPLYNGVKELEVGVPKGVGLKMAAPRREGSVVYYGTSIAQGGCASRPGMAFTSILSRRLDRPFVNLAFSGNGMMEESVGRFLVELDPALYVIDCLPNMNVEQVRERTVPIVKQLRKVRPGVPIVLVEDRTHAGQWVSKKQDAEREARRAALRAGYEQLIKDGEGKLFYLKGDELLGEDGEATVDGSHPTDLGMVRYADQLEPVLRRALG
jgi:lysophospholipase L1-like esterase